MRYQLKKLRLLFALVAAASMTAAACGSSDVADAVDDANDVAGEVADDAADVVDDAADTTQDAADSAADAVTGDGPGTGVTVTMARANWSTGYMQAAIYQQLLTELGYEVADPSANEMDPATFFPAVAQGDVDFWANTWFPAHKTQFIDGTPVEGRVEQVGLEMEAGGLQGIMIDKATADANDITQLDQIAADPELSALFDVTGDGIADVHACDVGWGCEQLLEEWFTANSWNDTTLDQLSGSYNAVFSEAVGRITDGEPTLVYTWTPSAYVTQLIPGDNVYWLSTSAPLAGQEGAASIGEEQCPGQPCEMGFIAADIMVSANPDFLAANPAAAKLFELVKIPVTDVALQNVLYDGGEDTEDDVARHAADWISQNRDLVDGWLTDARAAA